MVEPFSNQRYEPEGHDVLPHGVEPWTHVSRSAAVPARQLTLQKIGPPKNRRASGQAGGRHEVLADKDGLAKFEKTPVVILAAGEGSRLSPDNNKTPKPLQMLLGLSLAERCVTAFSALGLKRFIVVLGYENEIVRAHFEEIGRRRDLSIKFVEASDWQKGNGASTLAAFRKVKEQDFLLTMVDHVYTPELVRRFLTQLTPSDDILLGIDFCKENLFDVPDATKVRVANGAFVEIGKNIGHWDASDTGLFCCHSKLFESLQKVQEQESYGLSAGISELIKKGKVRGIDISGEAWIDVDTPEALKEARHRLLTHLGKNSEDGFISRWINRKVSKKISQYLVYTSITPNQITIFSFLLSIFGSLLIAMNQSIGAICGALLVQFASIIDGCDGEIARLKKIQTRRGAWFDTVLDRYADIVLAFAVTYAAATVDNSSVYWMLGFFCMAGLVLTSYVKKEYQIRFLSPFPDGLLSQLCRRDLRVFVIALSVIIGFSFYGLIAIGLLSHLCVFFMLVYGFKRKSAGRVEHFR